MTTYVRVSAQSLRLGRWVSCNDEIIEEPPNPAKRRKTFAPDDYITCDQVYMLIYQKEDSGPAEQPPPDIMRQVEMEDARFEYDMDERAVKWVKFSSRSTLADDYRKERLEDEFAHLHGAKKDVLMSVPRVSHGSCVHRLSADSKGRCRSTYCRVDQVDQSKERRRSVPIVRLFSGEMPTRWSRSGKGRSVPFDLGRRVG